MLWHKRYYRLFKKSLNIYKLQKHLTKLKKIGKFSYFKEVGSQAIQDITQRIDRAYKLFLGNLKHKIRTAPPSLKRYENINHSRSNKLVGSFLRVIL